MITLSIKKKNIFYLMQDVIIHTVISFGFIIFLFFYLLDDDFRLFIFLAALIISVYLGTVLIPVLILYFNYLLYNKNVVIILQDKNILINNTVIEINSIKEIAINATYQHFNEHTGSTSLGYNDYFYFLRITTLDDSDFYLTSLLGYELDKKLKEKYPSVFLEIR